MATTGVWPPYPGVVLQRGMNGPSIRQVQERLNTLGASPALATDGIFGPLTEAAVMAFQRSAGITVNGIVGPVTWNALFTNQPVSPPPTPPAAVWPPYPGVVLRRGMNGPSIRQVQERLNTLGASPALATDGIFGPLTEAAVMAFQRSRGLTADGIVGPITWNALFSNQPVPPPQPQAHTIVLDPGHGGNDPGAVAGTRREADDVLRLSLAVQALLQARGQRVVITRSTDVFVSLSERSAISNRNNADIFVSVHRNASTNTAANGVENYVFTTAPTGTVQGAFDVLDRVVDAGVQNNRGVLRGNFAVLRNTQAPAMLLEMGFISNARDNQLFDQNFNAYAAAIADGIMAALSQQGTQPYFFYNVVAGDNIFAVAARFGTTANAIMQLNKLTTSNLIIGQILKIPG